jgi:hypothetical protein
MAVNHNINVNLRKGTKSISSRGKTSAVRGIQSNNTSRKSNNNSSRQLARGLRAVRTLDTGALGLFGGMGGATMAVVQETVKIANRVVDIALDINLARTGESINVGNIKRIKGYLLNPQSYIIDATYGLWLNTLKINRENESNAYYRELSGNLIVSNQYGIKR